MFFTYPVMCLTVSRIQERDVTNLPTGKHWEETVSFTHQVHQCPTEQNIETCILTDLYLIIITYRDLVVIKKNESPSTITLR